MSLTPRQFCQDQLLMLGDEELAPTAQAASIHILQSAIMADPDARSFQAQLELLAGADGGSPGGAADVARVLLEAWTEARSQPDLSENP